MTPTKQDPGTIHTYKVELLLRPKADRTEAELEEFTFDVERVLYDHACGEAWGAAVACSFDPPGIEIDLTIDAVSGSLVNRRVSEIFDELEKHLAVSFTLEEQKLEEEAGEPASPATAS